MSEAEERDERGYWESLDSSHRRRLAVALVVVALVAVAAAVVFLVASGRGTPERILDSGGKIIGGPPVELPTGTVSPTSSVSPTGSAGTSRSAGATAPLAYVRAPFVAYRLDDSIWVSREDGSAAKRVASAASGAFRLSPDGRTLAYQDPDGVLRLAPVAGGAGKVVAGAAPDCVLSWSTSSSWVVFESGTAEAAGISRADRGGSAVTRIAAGRAPSVSPDDRVLFVASQGARLGAVDSNGGSFAEFTGTGGALTSTWVGRSGVAFLRPEVSSAGGSSTEYGLWLTSSPSSAPRLVTVRPFDGRAMPSAICASPDGRHVSWADEGDDGYSRTWIVDVSGGVPVSASKRYDTYPLCWSSDGTRLLLIEGNAWQGQKTRLVSLSADGTDKKVLVEGAGR